MSITRPFAEAKALLGLDADAGAAAIKRAYRKLVMVHPPDTDPDGFRKVRDAYELLTEPGERVTTMLFETRPFVDPPPLPASPILPDSEPLLVALLRLVASPVDAGALLAGQPKPEPPSHE